MNSSVPWNVQITAPAQKELQRLPAGDQQRVKAALLSMQEDPFRGDIKRLKGHPTAWRRRVGNYRIVYNLYFDARLIVVAGVLRRTSTTY
jgi:mRNA interferase RelE/StbE